MSVGEHGPDRLTQVLLTLCDACLDGVGGECHTPGCALWISAAPDIPIRERAAMEAESARPVTPEAVERAAEAAFLDRYPVDKWAFQPESVRETWRGNIVAALEAAFPAHTPEEKT